MQEKKEEIFKKKQDWNKLLFETSKNLLNKKINIGSIKNFDYEQVDKYFIYKKTVSIAPTIIDDVEQPINFLLGNIETGMYFNVLFGKPILDEENIDLNNKFYQFTKDKRLVEVCILDNYDNTYKTFLSKLKQINMDYVVKTDDMKKEITNNFLQFSTNKNINEIAEQMIAFFTYNLYEEYNDDYSLTRIYNLILNCSNTDPNQTKLYYIKKNDLGETYLEKSSWDNFEKNYSWSNECLRCVLNISIKNLWVVNNPFETGFNLRIDSIFILDNNEQIIKSNIKKRQRNDDYYYFNFDQHQQQQIIKKIYNEKIKLLENNEKKLKYDHLFYNDLFYMEN